jgi:glycosyltransferase involved in cell wall biosynthesis
MKYFDNIVMYLFIGGILLGLIDCTLLIITIINPLIIQIDFFISILILSTSFFFISTIIMSIEFLINLIKPTKKKLLGNNHEKIPNEFIDKIFVIIPAYNEETSIIKAIKECKKYVNNVIVINDGSIDNTAKIAQKENVIVVSHFFNKGLAQAMKTGIAEALKSGAEVIVNFDADMQYDAADIPNLVMPILNNQFDLMIGSRFEGKIIKMPISKKLANKLFSKVIALFTKSNITDAQSGYRAFSAKFAKSIKIRRGFTYTQQMIIEASEKNFRIGEIPTVFSERRDGNSRLMKGIFHFAFAAWILIFRVYAEYKPLKLFSFPILFLSILSLITLNFSLIMLVEGTESGLTLILMSAILFCSSVIISAIALVADAQKPSY